MPFGLVGSQDFFNVVVILQENILDGKQSIFLKANKLSARFLYPAPSVLRFQLAGHFITSLVICWQITHLSQSVSSVTADDELGS